MVRTCGMWNLYNVYLLVFFIQSECSMCMRAKVCGDVALSEVWMELRIER